MEEDERTNSELTLDARVAVVQKDVTHLAHRVDQVQGNIEQTRDELKESIAGVERDLKEMRREQDTNLKLARDELKSDMHRVKDELKSDIREIFAVLKDMIRDLKADNTEVRSAMRTELGHDRKVLYALCVTAIVMMIGLLGKGVFY